MKLNDINLKGFEQALTALEWLPDYKESRLVRIETNLTAQMLEFHENCENSTKTKILLETYGRL